MKKTKLEKGITLIALIITIIILLILAVVTIGTIKKSDIIGYAQKASNAYIVEQEKEQIELALSEWQIQKVLGEKTFKKVVESSLEGTAREVTGSEDGPLTITMKTGNKYIVTNDGKIDIVEVKEPIPAPEGFPYGLYYTFGMKETCWGAELEKNRIKYPIEIINTTINKKDEKNIELTVSYSEEESEIWNLVYYVTDNNIIINLGTNIFAKSIEGISFGLEGDYVREDGLMKLNFSKTNEYVRVYKKTTIDDQNFLQISKDDYSYFRLGDKYYFSTGDMFEISDNGKILTINGEIYINESAAAKSVKDEIKLITPPDNTDFIYGTYYMCSPDQDYPYAITIGESTFSSYEYYDFNNIKVDEKEEMITLSLLTGESLIINYHITQNNIILYSADLGMFTALSQNDLIKDLNGEYINKDGTRKFSFDSEGVKLYNCWNGTDWYLDNKAFDFDDYAGLDNGIYCIGGNYIAESNENKTNLKIGDEIYTKK